MKKDDLGNTALLCAVENRNFVVAAFLARTSPWHTVNKAGRTFLRALEIVECHGNENKAAKMDIMTLAKEVQTTIILKELDVFYLFLLFPLLFLSIHHRPSHLGAIGRFCRPLPLLGSLQALRQGLLHIPR
jgi:hypothetical protein